MDQLENKSDESLAARILDKIKNNKISPKPRWQFLLKNYVVWITGVLALLIGAAAVSVMIYLFKYNGWESYEATHKTFGEFFLLTLPYFWFIFLGLFVFVVYYNLKHTPRGYRYPFYIVVIAPIALSIILGSGFFLIGWGEKIDNVLGSQAPFYDHVINRHVDFWSQPIEGRLVGLVVSKSPDRRFKLVDRDQTEWLVTLVDNPNGPPMPPFAEELVVVGRPLNLIGEELDDHEFAAFIIMPLRGGRGFFHRFDRQLPIPEALRCK